MSEPTKSRFIVDLDEIDRQLRRTATPSSPVAGGEGAPGSVGLPGGSGRDFAYGASEAEFAHQTAEKRPASPQNNFSDSMQELARIVGQEDPFQSILGQKGGAPQPQSAPLAPNPLPPPSGGYGEQQRAFPEGIANEAERSSAVGGSPEVGNLSRYHRADGQPAGSMAGFSPAPYPSYSRQASALSTEDLEVIAGMAQQGGKSPLDQDPRMHRDTGAPFASAPMGSYASETMSSVPTYDDYTPSYADPKLGYQPGYHDEDESGYERPRSGKRKLLLVAGVAGLAILVGVSAYGLLRGKGVIGGGEPPLVSASTEPTKVAPDVPGGKEFPDQNKQIYQGNAQEGSTKVINREEQPVDIREATGARGDSSVNSDLGDARRVRTSVVDPRGALIGGDPPPAAVEQRAAPSGSPFPLNATGNPIPPRPNNGGGVASPQSVASVAEPTTAQTSQSGSGQMTSQATPAAPPTAQPTPPLPPPRSPALASVSASASRQPVAEQPPSARPSVQPAATHSSGGAYTVQFGVASSEADGRARFNRLKGQFPDVFDNVSGSIHPAEVSGRTVYRIRTGGMSKEASDALCANFKAAGGKDCFVARSN